MLASAQRISQRGLSLGMLRRQLFVAAMTVCVCVCRHSELRWPVDSFAVACLPLLQHSHASVGIGRVLAHSVLVHAPLLLHAIL